MEVNREAAMEDAYRRLLRFQWALLTGLQAMLCEVAAKTEDKDGKLSFALANSGHASVVLREVAQELDAAMAGMDAAARGEPLN